VPNYYLDIETTGLDPKEDKIITIQFAELDRNTADQIGELQILKLWNYSSEKELLDDFILKSNINDSYPFSFVPVGYNLSFEHNFFYDRCKVNDLEPIDILNNPFIDLRSIGIIMNNGEFKGSGLDKLTNKKQIGSIIPKLYPEQRYSEIEDYIRDEAKEFVDFAKWLYNELPLLLNKYKSKTDDV